VTGWYRGGRAIGCGCVVCRGISSWWNCCKRGVWNRLESIFLVGVCLYEVGSTGEESIGGFYLCVMFSVGYDCVVFRGISSGWNCCKRGVWNRLESIYFGRSMFVRGMWYWRRINLLIIYVRNVFLCTRLVHGWRVCCN